MPHAVPMPSAKLQALILCGPGSSFPTFMSNPDENPKALLPIANRPMVWYPIDFCLRSGITNISLICPHSAAPALSAALKTNPCLTSLPLPRPDVVAPVGLDHNTGTAQILRLPEVRELIESDFVVLPCDLVCELAGEELIQAWMVKLARLPDLLDDNSSLDYHARQSGGLGVWYDTKDAMLKRQETDFIATTPLDQGSASMREGSVLGNLSELLLSMPTDSLQDLMEDRRGLSLRHGLSRAHPRLRIFTTLRDAHAYIFPRWVLDFVQENESLESIGEDVVGWWAKAWWQKGLAEKLHLNRLCACDSAPSMQDDDESALGSLSSTRVASPERLNPAKSLAQAEARMKQDSQQGQDQDGDVATSRGSEAKIPPVLAYVHSTQGQDGAPLIRRVDTGPLLLATSLLLAKIPSTEETGTEGASPFAHARKIAYPEGVKARTTVTKQDSLVAENVTVEERTAIKESVVGANCQIREGAKLSQCLLMEGVVVGKGCKLSKCILGKRCVIGDGTILTDCEVQENLLVEERTEDRDNRLMSSEGLEATAADLVDVLEQVDEVDEEEVEEVAAKAASMEMKAAAAAADLVGLRTQ